MGWTGFMAAVSIAGVRSRRYAEIVNGVTPLVAYCGCAGAGVAEGAGAAAAGCVGWVGGVGGVAAGAVVWVAGVAAGLGMGLERTRVATELGSSRSLR